MSGARHWEQDKEATVYIGNLDERVTDSLVWELMLQAGRIVNVHLPKDRVTQTHQGYGFVEFVSEEDAEYAAKIMNQVRLYGKPIRVNKASADKLKTVEVGAELFIGNLDPMVTEQVLYDTFSRFGALVSIPKVARDDNALSKGYGFVSFSDFEASDNAIANMNGQFLMNKEISVQYAYKKDGKGERHGDQAERMLAAQARKHNVQLANPMPPPPTNPAAAAAAGGIPPPLAPTGPSPLGAPTVPPVPVPAQAAYPTAPTPTAPMAMAPDFAAAARGGMPPPMPYAMHHTQAPHPHHRGPMPPVPPAGAPQPPHAMGHAMGLPPRPPPSQGGYGGPHHGHAPPPPPPGLGGAGAGARYAPPPPAGFGGVPVPTGPAGTGAPPPPPPGFGQAPYARGGR